MGKTEFSFALMEFIVEKKREKSVTIQDLLSKKSSARVDTNVAKGGM